MAKARNLSKDELSKLLNALRGHYVAPIKVIIFFGIMTGYRIAEILSLRIPDVIASDNEIKSYVTVKAKFMKRKKEARTVLMPPLLREVLKDYVFNYLGGRFAPRRNAYLFQSGIGNSNPLSYNRVWRVLKSAVDRSGINPRGVTSHFMRKTWVRGFLDETDPKNKYDTLQAAGQWKNRDSMMHYIPKNEETARIEETQLKLGELHQGTAKEFFNIK